MKLPTTLNDLVNAAFGGDKPSGQFPPELMAEAERRVRAADRAAAEAERAAAEAKREKLYAVRAERCEAVLNHLTSKMTGAELDRWGKIVDIARRTALRMHTTSRDLKLDIGMILPPAILERAGIEPSPDNIAWTTVPAAKDPWRSRLYAVPDSKPAGNADQPVTAEQIVAAAAKARGPIDESKKIIPGDAVKLVSSDTWLKQ